MTRLDRALRLVEERLGPVDGAPVALEEGNTNTNFRIVLAGAEPRPAVLRCCEPGTAVLGIDRAAELVATRRAEALGIGPPVLAAWPEEEVMVIAWLPGGMLTAEQVREPATLAWIARALRTFHGSGPLPATFDVFRVAERHHAIAVEHDRPVPDGYDEIAALLGRIERVLHGPEHAPAACHNDLLTTNFVADGTPGGLRIVDWEYAGMNDPYFDLANLSVNNGLDEDDDRRLLEAYFGEPPDDRRFAALRLMRIVSDVREAMWGLVQSAVSQLDNDYAAYAETYFARLRGQLADPRVGAWLDRAAVA